MTVEGGIRNTERSADILVRSNDLVTTLLRTRMSALVPVIGDDIVARPHFMIGPCGADFHFSCTELVKKEGKTPAIHQFAASVNS